MDATGRAVLDIISGYADTWRLLLEFDEDRLAVPGDAKPARSALDYDRAVGTIADFKGSLGCRWKPCRSSLVYLSDGLT